MTGLWCDWRRPKRRRWMSQSNTARHVIFGDLLAVITAACATIVWKRLTTTVSGSIIASAVGTTAISSLSLHRPHWYRCIWRSQAWVSAWHTDRSTVYLSPEQ